MDSQAQTVAISSFPDVALEIMRRVSPPELSNDDSSRIPPVQVEGGMEWEEFSSHATVLEKDLHKFQDAVKELGSSLELTDAVRKLRRGISSTSRLFQENACKLFPKSVPPTRAPPSKTTYSEKIPRLWNPMADLQSDAGYHLHARPLHVELTTLARSVENLRLTLQQFQELGDTEDLPLMHFESDLKYWSSCLERYKGKSESSEVRQFVHDLSGELGARYEEISFYIKELIDSAPTVRLAQKNVMASLQNISTIATFFSAVTATTLQYSFQNNTNGVSKAVNVLWFNSLVFSIASALNSFLVLTWRRANYSSPQIHIPWWLWICIRHSPPMFLLISVVMFLTGLGCFSLSSGQARITFIVVILSETISVFGLAALLVWLTYEKLSFHRQQRNQLPKLEAPQYLPNDEKVLPQYNADARSPTSPEVVQSTAISPSFTPVPSGRGSEGEAYLPRLPQTQKEAASNNWRRILNKIRVILKISREARREELQESEEMDILDPSLRKLAILHELPSTDINDIQFDPSGTFLAICSDVLWIRFGIQSAPRNEWRHHIRQARQIVWTPSANYLVTRNISALHVWHPSGGVGGRPIMRNNSCYILALPICLQITKDSRSLSTGVDGPPQLLSLEGTQRNTLAVFDITGKEYMNQEFKEICIRHMDLSSDGSRVLLAAVITHVGVDRPTRASMACKLIVFNLELRKTEHEVLLWHDVQSVSMSSDGKWAVVTFKDYTPPQLWMLRHTLSGIQISLERQFCAREGVSIPKFDPGGKHIEFSGSAHFIGKDRYIICARPDGKIHIWRRDKCHPVYINGGLSLDKDKPVQITCNRQSDDFMFATRSYDGTVRIWKVPDFATQLDTRGDSNVHLPTRQLQ